MKPHFLIALVVAALAASAAEGQSQSYSPVRVLEATVEAGTATPDQQVELARLYLDAGRAYEARKLVDRVLAASPGHAEASSLRERAVAQLRDVSNRNVGEVELRARASSATDTDRLDLADAYFSAGRYREAATAYAALPATSLTRESRLRRARALGWSRQMDEAEVLYASLIAEERTPDLDLEYGRILSWMGAGDLAIVHLARAHAALNREDTVVALANAHAWAGHRETAIRLLREYVAANGGAQEAQRLLADTESSPYLQLEILDRQIAAEPLNLALRLRRARLLLEMRDYGEAMRTVRFIHENSDEPMADLADLERRLAEYRREELERLDERRPSMTSASGAEDQVSLAKAYASLEAYDKAIALYEEYLRANPDDVEVRIMYARVLSWDRRYNAAQTQYEKILAVRPHRADLRLEYAQTLSWNREYTGAMRAFNDLTDISDDPRAARLYSDVPARAHFNIGQIYRWFGWNEHAMREQNAAIAIDSTFEPAALELERVRQIRPRSGLEARYTTISDSNDFDSRRYDLTGDVWTSRTTAFSAGLGRHIFENGNDQVEATALFGGVRHRMSDRLMARARVGFNLYSDDLGTRPFWGVGVDYLPNLQSRFALDYNRYDLIYDVFTLSSLGAGSGNVLNRDPVSINDFRAHYDHNTGGRWSWLVDTSYGFISDDNNRLGAHGLLTFKVLDKPFVAVKADARYLSYDFRTPGYWSPEDYRSFAGIVQVGQNLDWLEWSAELKAGRAFERDRSSDIRAYGVNLTVPVNDMIDIIGDWGYGKSGRFDSVLGGDPNDFTRYWRRHWFVGIRLKQLFGGGRRPSDDYYFDNRPTSSPVIPSIGETH